MDGVVIESFSFAVSEIMSLSDQQLLRRINETIDALSSSECRSLLYLCGSLEADSSVAQAKELLKAKLTSGPTQDDRILLELMFHLKRFDILRNVFGLNRDGVEAILRHNYSQVLSRFRVLMVNVSEDMANEDLNSVKFLLSKTLPREKMDKAKDFLDVIVELEKLDQVSSERVDFLEQCLRNIGRVDLAKKVHMYDTSGGSFDPHSASRISLQQMPRTPIRHPISNVSRPIQQNLGYSHHRVQATSPLSVATQHNRQTAPESYDLHSDPRGLCVIIDCVGYDGDLLEQRFKALHFNVLVHKWLSVNDILSTLRGIFHHRENVAVDSFICCIISRSRVNNLLGTDSNVTGLPLDRVKHLFTAQECPVLAGKPKVFFIQSYKVHESQDLPSWTNHLDECLETDGYDNMFHQDSVPTGADIFWSHCWTDEFELTQVQHHSNYLKALADALHKGQSRKSHLLDIHTEVNSVIYDHNRKNPGAKYHIDLKHTLRKNLYL